MLKIGLTENQMFSFVILVLESNLKLANPVNNKPFSKTKFWIFISFERRELSIGVLHIWIKTNIEQIITLCIGYHHYRVKHHHGLITLLVASVQCWLLSYKMIVCVSILHVHILFSYLNWRDRNCMIVIIL